MATFIGCRAEGNGTGGFFTSNPFSRFVDCEAHGNRGSGFHDESDRSLDRVLLAIRDDGMPEDKLAELSAELRLVLEMIQKSESSAARNSYARIVELTANHVTIAAPLLSALFNAIAQISGA
jgi:hypothetical protein